MSKKIGALAEFLDLVATHHVLLRIDGDDDSVTVTISYPKGMKSKIRDAMRDWAADHETQVLLATFALARGWKPEGLEITKTTVKGETPPVTAIH